MISTAADPQTAANPVDLELPALAQVATPRAIQRLARSLALLLLVAAVLIAVAPWQQTASGTGRVIAFAPLERRQVIDAQINGRVTRWWARENTYVAAGDPVVEVLDNDPNLVANLTRQRDADQTKVQYYRDKVRRYETYLEAVRAQRGPAVEAAKQNVASAEQAIVAAEQDLLAAQADAKAADLQQRRVQGLLSDGIVSTRDAELAEAKLQETSSKVEASEAKLAASRNKLTAEQSYLIKTDQEALSKIGAAEADLATAQAELADAEKSFAMASSKLDQQRNATIIRAPVAGRVLKLAAMVNAESIKAGDPLFELVPETDDLAVELYVDGFNMPLVDEGRKVRLQFEGWPAVQIPGWPSAAVGTFGGVVTLVDATDDGAGNFRVVVRPDPQDEPWPGPRWLKQGVRANGWVLLGQVPIAYEIWRQLNGFPPVVAMEEPQKGRKDKSKDDEKSKPPLPKA